MILSINYVNAYLYFAIYFLVSFITMKLIPKDKKQKVLTYVPTTNAREKRLVVISRIFRIATFSTSVFVPINYGSWNFHVGTLLYFLGLILTSVALWQFSKVAVGQPITSGIYRLSRHPMQVMFYVLCIGVVIASLNLYLLISVSIYIISSYPMMSIQEEYCARKYGIVYSEYMKQTPRILFWNKKENLND